MSPEQSKPQQFTNEKEKEIPFYDLKPQVDILIKSLRVAFSTSRKYDKALEKMVGGNSFRGSVEPITFERPNFRYWIERYGNELVDTNDITVFDNEVSLGWQWIHIMRGPVNNSDANGKKYTEDLFMESYQNSPARTNIHYRDLATDTHYKPNTLSVIEKARKIVTDF